LTTEVRSVCPYCGVGCGLLVGVERSRIVSVRGDPDHPANAGRLCAKGQRLAETVRGGDRLLRPMVRPVGRGGRFDRSRPPAPVSWEVAVGAVAGRIRDLLERSGPDSVAIYLSGQLTTEDYYAANKLGKGLIGTANVDTNSRLCMSSTVAAYKRAFGQDGPPGCYDDLEAAADVVLWGSNALETHPVLFSRLAAARRDGVTWTVVDPRRTPTAAGADRHLAIRPGSDVALTLAMCATVLGEGLADEARVRETCAGLEELRAAAAAMPAERAGPICGVAPETIRGLARRIAESPAALSLWCQGLNQSSSGTDKVSSLINLHLLTGQIGRPGAGPFSLTGQANAMGGREVGGLATELAAHRDLGSAADRAELEQAWGLGPVPSARGLTATELVDAMASGRVRLLWVVCSNPAASLPDGAAVRRALGSLEMLIVQELYHPTDTSVLADVLLPAAGWGEAEGTLTSSERRVALAEAAVAPPGECRPDWEIFAEVGRALGGGRAFAWPDAAAVFAEHVALTRGRDLDMTGLSHEVLRRDGPQHWPYPAGGRPQQRRYADGRYATPDGRARLVPVVFREPAEAPSREFPLRLTSGRDRDQWHTMSKTGRVAALRAESRIAIQLHPDDAAACGTAGGDTVLVASPRGSLRAVASVTPSAAPGCARVSFHRGPLLEPEGWANALFGRFTDPVSFQPELKHTVVRVTPLLPARVALAGGELAEAVAAALCVRGVEARMAGPEGLAGAPDGVRRVRLDQAPPAAGELVWWRAAAGELPARAGCALLDLRRGPEPLSALPALRRAGWEVARLGAGGLPPAVLGLLDRCVPAAGPDPGALLVVAPAAPATEPEPAPERTLVLRPGGALGLVGPLASDPGRLAGFLAGAADAVSAVRCVRVPLDRFRTLVAAGRDAGEAGTGAEADVLLHEDETSRTAQVWRVAAGRLLGVAAVVPTAVAEDVQALWLGQPAPDVLLRRFPVH
jgi:assimilatory nitrate reductase catalytic subunit